MIRILLSIVSLDAAYVAVGSNHPTMVENQSLQSAFLPDNPLDVTYTLPVIVPILCQAMLLDQTMATPFPPSTSACKQSGNDCFSYIVSRNFGNMSIKNGSSTEDILSNRVKEVMEVTEATSYVVSNATGYQLEYFPVATETNFDDALCNIFGTESSFEFPLRLCLKDVGDSLVSATHLPPNVDSWSHRQNGLVATLS